MKLLIGLPTYAGTLSTITHLSLQEVEKGLRDEGIDFGVMPLMQESLIPRGRNSIAMQALKGNFTDLFFIDADLGFNWEKFRKVLMSDKRIIGGTYPIKKFPITMNFNAYIKDLKRAGVDGPMNQDNYFKFVKECADKNGEVQVAHVPTGFLRIKVDVFHELIKKDPEGKKVEPYVTKNSVTHEKNSFRDFFKIGVMGLEYLSEDWFFCEHANYEGIPVYLQTQAVCSHFGVHEFNLGQHIIVGQEPLIPQGKQG